MPYLVAKAFQSHLGWHQPGEVLPPEADGWAATYYLKSALFIYDYVPEKGYDRLPPHVFNAVVTRQEALGLIAKGDAPAITEWFEPPQVTQAIETNEAQQASEQENFKLAHAAAVKKSEAQVRDAAVTSPVSEKTPKPRTDAKKNEAAAAAQVQPIEVKK